ncbi:MAG: helix-turn-helix domain-containing protein [Cyanobacteria bacterium]|nr:helix-turn-helix domain-containing protein [Cyanobacteriota bacterium]
MAASRLNDSQKQEVVLRYQAGETAAALAEAFSCSANTVSRTIKAAIGLEAYGAIKDLRIAGSAVKTIGKPEIAQDLVELELTHSAAFVVNTEEEDYVKEELEINDLEIESNSDFIAFAPLAVTANLSDSSPCVSKPLVASELPTSLYLLVDREVELKGTPVKDFTELGLIASEEEELQAIALFINPRQAKRQCGRSQRVIKVPDSSLLELTAPYILAQGISRIVLEGALYAVPGSPVKP